MKYLILATVVLFNISSHAADVDREWLAKAIIKSNQRCHELVRNREFYGREIEGEANTLLKKVVTITFDDRHSKPLVNFHYEDKQVQYSGHVLFAINGQEIETMSFKRVLKIETRINSDSDSIRNPPRIQLQLRTYSNVVCRR